MSTNDSCVRNERHPYLLCSNQIPCEDCAKKYNMPTEVYCLDMCGEQEFCRGCTYGIYEKKE